MAVSLCVLKLHTSKLAYIKTGFNVVANNLTCSINRHKVEIWQEGKLYETAGRSG